MKIHLLISEPLPEGRGLLGLSLGAKGRAGTTFALSFYLVNSSRQAQHSIVALLKPVSVPWACTLMPLPETSGCPLARHSSTKASKHALPPVLSLCLSEREGHTQPALSRCLAKIDRHTLPCYSPAAQRKLPNMPRPCPGPVHSPSLVKPNTQLRQRPSLKHAWR